MVTIKFYGKTRNIAGNEAINLPIEGEIALQELLAEVIDKQTDASKEFSVILVNGRNCMFTGGLKTLIKDGDVIEVLPLVTGG